MTAETIAIQFGRWLLKNADPAFDKYVLCWKYEGEYYNTDELYKIFIDEF